MFVVFAYPAGVMFRMYDTAGAAKRVAAQYNRNAGFVRTSRVELDGVFMEHGAYADGKPCLGMYVAASEADFIRLFRRK